MTAPLYVTIECVLNDGLHFTTVNCLDLVPTKNSRGYYLVPQKEGIEITTITQKSYELILAALSHANAQHYGIEAIEFIVEVQ